MKTNCSEWHKASKHQSIRRQGREEGREGGRDGGEGEVEDSLVVSRG